MARPAKEGLDYFPHDTDAFNDEKIEALRMMHKANGYMFYFFHLERIYRSPSFCVVSDAETRQIFARKLEITQQEYDSIMETCLKYHCFDVEKYTKHGILTSNGIQKRAMVVVDKRNKAKNLYVKRVSDAETRQKLDRNSTETRQNNSRNAAESTQSKVKESKVKESIEIPDWIDSKNWESFKENRKALKKPMTHQSIVLTINKLSKMRDKGYDVNEILNESIINGWAGVFEPKNNGKAVRKDEFGNLL